MPRARRAVPPGNGPVTPTWSTPPVRPRPPVRSVAGAGLLWSQRRAEDQQALLAELPAWRAVSPLNLSSFS